MDFYTISKVSLMEVYLPHTREMMWVSGVYREQPRKSKVGYVGGGLWVR